MSRSQVFDSSTIINEEKGKKKKTSMGGKIKMLRHMAQFVQLREFVKNGQESTEYKISMISQVKFVLFEAI